MNSLLRAFLKTTSASFRARRDLALENLALRHQLAVLQRSTKRPRISRMDRAFWVVLSRIWARWGEALVLVRPATVVAWHRKGFRLYWTWKSRKRLGRPSIPSELRELIRKMSTANPLWGAPRIHGELLKLGIRVSQATVSKHMARRSPNPPSQTWRTFLQNHTRDLVSVDFFVVPTVSFRVLFVFLVLSHERRQVGHFNVTAHPTATWTAQQLIEAFPWDTAPRYLLRDRDGVYGEEFRHRVRSLSIDEVLTAPRSPWQSPYVERLIGSLRRECLDHLIVFSERHVRRVLSEYLRYYHRSRSHLSLHKDCPETRPVEPPERGKVIELPQVGGLHHRYTRRAA
jgi:transposase InsO family protein